MEKDMKVDNASLKDKTDIALKLRNEADRFKKELDELKSRPVDVAVETREAGRRGGEGPGGGCGAPRRHGEAAGRSGRGRGGLPGPL